MSIRRRKTACYAISLLWLVVLTGCQCFSHRTTWNAPTVICPQNASTSWHRPGEACFDTFTTSAESAYARAFALEANGMAACVDHYYLAASVAWTELTNQLAVGNTTSGRIANLYRSSLSKLITSGQEYGRLDPVRGLSVKTSTGYMHIPMAYHGFPWQPGDFNALIPVGDYRTKELNRIYSTSGIGVATVVRRSRRQREGFLQKEQVFAATALLRSTDGQDGYDGMVLELIDPLRISHVQIASTRVTLRRDLSAPLAFVFKDIQRNYLEEFIQPGRSSSETGLFMIEPYQPGKIPIVFVHGLLSDPYTWANIANEVRARPDLMERYQIWAFEYATGEPFLKSAAVLREQLQQVKSSVSARYGCDSALNRTVLVGHSMGGLVSKLQVTHSGNAIWTALSNQPIETIATVPATRMRLAESAYFKPSPLVSRVVYVGTPHRGSPWATRWIGRIGTSLVEEPSSLQDEHTQLVRDNPKAFSDEFTRRIPTSIDLLRPDSCLLRAIDGLPVASHVREHSVIGSFRPMLCAGDSDGVVPVASARRQNAVSEKVIRARHEDIHNNNEGIEELVRILRMHLQEVR